MELLALAILIAALAYGLERNHARQVRRSGPYAVLHGSSDVQDRDLERVRHDLHPC